MKAALLKIASEGLRLHHRPYRSRGDTGRDRIGRSERNRWSSSRSSAAEANRWAGSLAIARWTIVSRSRGIVESTRRKRHRFLTAHLVDQGVAVVGLECRPAGEQLVEGETQGVDVGTGVAAAVESFGGHVADRPHDIAGARQIAVAVDLGQAEVGDPDRAVDIEQEVRRLDVAVQDPVLMGVIEGFGHLEADASHAPGILAAESDVEERPGGIGAAYDGGPCAARRRRLIQPAPAGSPSR